MIVHPMDAVTPVAHARQEKDALEAELLATLRVALERDPNAHADALGVAVGMLAPGQLRALINAVRCRSDVLSGNGPA